MHNLDPYVYAIFGCLVEGACNYNCSQETHPDISIPCSDNVTHNIDGFCTFEDECLVCVPAGNNDCEQDCTGEWGGTAVYDECGECDGDNSTCLDCAGVPNGDAVEDCLGICNGNSICFGCLDPAASNYDENFTGDCSYLDEYETPLICCEYEDQCRPKMGASSGDNYIKGDGVDKINVIPEDQGFSTCYPPFQFATIPIAIMNNITMYSVRKISLEFFSSGGVVGNVQSVKLSITSADSGVDIKAQDELEGVVSVITEDLSEVVWDYESNFIDLFELIPTDSDVIDQRVYRVIFNFIITTPQDEGDDITYTEEVPVDFNYINCVKGDMNGDGGWNILDVVSLANCVLSDTCEDADDGGCAGDTNDDLGWNVLDIVALVNCVLAETCEGAFD